VSVELVDRCFIQRLLASVAFALLFLVFAFPVG
jgi:hypothetical protein